MAFILTLKLSGRLPTGSSAALRIHEELATLSSDHWADDDQHYKISIFAPMILYSKFNIVDEVKLAIRGTDLIITLTYRWFPILSVAATIIMGGLVALSTSFDEAQTAVALGLSATFFSIVFLHSYLRIRRWWYFLAG
jgi:hypothetical protein